MTLAELITEVKNFEDTEGLYTLIQAVSDRIDYLEQDDDDDDDDSDDDDDDDDEKLEIRLDNGEADLETI